MTTPANPPRGTRTAAALSLALLILLTAAAPPAVSAGSPTDQIRRHADEMVALLQAPAAEAAGREARARSLVGATFALSETARRVLGGQTPALQDRELAELAGLLEGFFARAYLAILASYADRAATVRDRVRYVDERVAGDRASVSLTIPHPAGALPIEVRMLRRDSQWLIHDIVIYGVSLTANYRAQLEQVVRRTSYREAHERIARRQTLLALKAGWHAPTDAPWPGAEPGVDLARPARP